jgi:hypothetical protein
MEYMALVRRRRLASGSHRLWVVFRPGERKPSAVFIRGFGHFDGAISRRLLGAVDASELSPVDDKDKTEAPDWLHLLADDDEYDRLVDELVDVVAQFPLLRPTEGFDTLDESIRRLNRLVGEFVRISDEVKQRYNEAGTHILDDPGSRASEPGVFFNDTLRRQAFARSSEDDIRLAIAIQGLQEFADGGEISSTVNRLLAQFNYPQLARTKVFDLVRRAERLLRTTSGRDRLSAIPTVPDPMELIGLLAKVKVRRDFDRALTKIMGKGGRPGPETQ